ncbi:hypothetical protein ATCC90586_008837 [Pythium insidiosum]|nr:hypothetical protein ATCC90586_008837 [Pythium insidiosum]
MPTPPASSTSSPQRPSAAAGTPAEEHKESPAPQVTASAPAVAQAASSAPTSVPSPAGATSTEVVPSSAASAESGPAATESSVKTTPSSPVPSAPASAPAAQTFQPPQPCVADKATSSTEGVVPTRETPPVPAPPDITRHETRSEAPLSSATGGPTTGGDTAADGDEQALLDLLGARVWASEPDRMRSDLGTLASKVSDHVRSRSLTSRFDPVRHGLVFERVLKILKKATQQPALLADFAFLVEGLGRPPMSQAPSGRILTEEERTIRLVEAERASLKGRVAVLEAEHSDLTDQLVESRTQRRRIAKLRAELEAFKALGSSPEEIGSREQRLQAVMTYAMTLAQIFDRASCEYEAVLGKLILGYDRRGRQLPSAEEIRSLMQDRPSRLQLDFASLPFLDQPDVVSVFEGLTKGMTRRPKRVDTR